ncbi:MAG: DUF1161 domain-containing protein [Terracidiphilus sp.]|jgi:hypothetical protein
MKMVASAALLLSTSVLVYAEGPKPCEELKAEIAKKLDANGAKSYTLEIVPKDRDAEGKVVGTCGGGTMKIMYVKASPPAEAPTPKPEKP